MVVCVNSFTLLKPTGHVMHHRFNIQQLYALPTLYEGKSISKLQIVTEKKRMGIMAYKQHLFFNVISKQI